MANARNKSIDTTHLSVDTALERGLIHRDYIAHCFRWSYAVKRIMRAPKDKLFKVLDIGCGVDTPLAKAIHSNRMGTYVEYTGVDYGKFEEPAQLKAAKNFRHKFLFGVDAASLTAADIGYTPDLITMFEVIEHVEPEHGIRMLRAIYDLMDGNTVFLLSTPNFNGSAAANHVAEWEHEMLEYALRSTGFLVRSKFGTFASQRDYVDQLEPAQRELYERLAVYYDSNVLSTIFAPLFPENARNCLWVLEKDAPARIPRPTPKYSPGGTSSDQPAPEFS